uniref:EF-hand_3 domain-containing protein n=1 Tax=Heterorhabditis bacteriophora TaxID=37862 RepID=A0A1I7XIV3_HETBA
MDNRVVNFPKCGPFNYVSLERLDSHWRQQTGRLSVFSIKIALATICAGKLVDKLRYMFSQTSDSSGFLEYDRFTDFLQQVLALTTAVFEAPTFGFSEAVVSQCFQKVS